MKLFLKRIRSYLPVTLPVSVTSLNQFIDDVIELSGPYADRNSMAFAISSMIIHQPAGRGWTTKNTFVQGMRKSAANQVASQIFQDIKEQQNKKLAEDTAAKQAKAVESSVQETQKT